MKNNWMLIVIVGAGLLAFGWFVSNGQKSKTPFVHRGPVTVAAVRGGSEPIESSGSSNNVAVDYVKDLQSDVSLAQKNADKYERAAKARNAAVNQAETAGN